jgi:hypothetical protein
VQPLQSKSGKPLQNSAGDDRQLKHKLLLHRHFDDNVGHQIRGRFLGEEVAVQAASPEVMRHLFAAVRLCNRKVVVVVVVEVVVVVDFWTMLLSLGFWAGPVSGVVNCK